MEATLTVNGKTINVGIKFLEEIAYNLPDIPEYQEVMHEIAQSQNTETRRWIANKDHISDDTARLLLEDSQPSVVADAVRGDAAKRILTEEDVERLVETGTNDVIDNLVGYASHYEQLEKNYVAKVLMAKENPAFDYMLATSWGTSDSIKKKLAESDDLDIAHAAKE